ncbi:MAG: isopenicillin N synthase family dioxygenase [Saprospiraceae bacterium]
MSKQRAIPLIDLGQFVNGNEAERAEVVKQVGDAFQDTGFVGVVNHGIDQQLINDYFRSSREFFKLPTEVKSRYEFKGMAGQRGYTSFGKEHAKQSQVADLKEFFQLGMEVPEGHPAFAKTPPNPQVQETPEFSEKGRELYNSFQAAGTNLLRAIAIYLDLDEHFFDQKIQYGNSILRAIYYPPIANEPASAIRAEQHEDINLITLLVGASSGGLQLLTQANEWVDVVPEEDEIVINVGDMLQRLTNNFLRSTTHRVVNPPREEWHTDRLSIPFFLHPVSEMDLTALPDTVTAERPNAYEPITAGAYLDERLREIGLKK